MINVKLVNALATLPEGDFFIAQPPMMLGRSLESEIRLEDPWVSRRHCRIDQVDAAVVVRDLGSTHGTFVNGCQVVEAVLEPGDKLSVGMSSFVVHYDGETATVAAGMSP